MKCCQRTSIHLLIVKRLLIPCYIRDIQYKNVNGNKFWGKCVGKLTDVSAELSANAVEIWVILSNLVKVS